ncbi:MAG: hypothetical protein AAF390_04265 [Pseudomonadota bacterium]
MIAGPVALPVAIGLPQEWILLGLAVVLFCAVLAFVVQRRLRLRRRALRREVSGLAEGARFRLVDAICHAVWRGGSIDADRLSRALEIARNATDMDYDKAHLKEVALRVDRWAIPFGFHWMRAGLDREEKLVIFNAAVSVMLASGRLSRADQRVLRRLSRGLGLRRADLRDLARLTAD